MSYTDEMIRFIINLKDLGYTWEEITSEFNETYEEDLGSPKTKNAIRKTYRRFRDLDLNADQYLSNLKQVHSSKKQSSKVAKENKIILESLVEKDSFMEELSEILAQNPIKVHKVKVPKKKKSKKTPRTIIANLSDTHFGVNISSEEVGGVNEFNPTIAARRLAFYTQEICNYKEDKRNETNLVLNVNGDIIAGIIHDQEHGVALMSTQFSMACSYLSQMISYCANNFKSVKVVCTVGNHSRYIHKNNKGRQSSAKWDSFITNVYSSLRLIFKKEKSIEIVTSEAPYVIFEANGHTYYSTHGDTNLSVGNPGKSFNMSNLTNRINALNIELMSGNKKKIDVILLGHHHVSATQLLNDGTMVIFNGCLSGIDGFANSIDIYANMPTQTLFESTEGYAVGDVRTIRVQQADKDESLDKIIEPFLGLF